MQPVKLGHPNVYFIKTAAGYIMVDVGMPNLEKQLDEVFDKARVDPTSVKLIMLTHGHMDHVGSIAYAKKVTGGDVLCHQSYRPLSIMPLKTYCLLSRRMKQRKKAEWYSKSSRNILSHRIGEIRLLANVYGRLPKR